jgi:hypothetical protein
VTLSATEPTYLDGYEVPSSGDVSISRSATLMLSGVEQATIEAVRFDAVGGNALNVLDYARDTLVDSCEFAWSGENAIALIGSARLIDGSDGQQPRGTRITRNLIRELGIFTKQCSAVFQSLAALSHIQHNVLFNGPRAGINFNDEFGGGNVVDANLGFNMVRETSDHGVFNSWHRTSFVTDVTGSLNLLTKTNVLSRNFFISNYASNWPVR